MVGPWLLGIGKAEVTGKGRGKEKEEEEKRKEKKKERKKKKKKKKEKKKKSFSPYKNFYKKVFHLTKISTKFFQKLLQCTTVKF